MCIYVHKKKTVVNKQKGQFSIDRVFWLEDIKTNTGQFHRLMSQLPRKGKLCTVHAARNVLSNLPLDTIHSK